jgi:CO/xanthine dehydrogenase FAD-binding subunit
VLAPKVARPRSLRQALELAFVHRQHVRWQAGRSSFLGFVYPGSTDGAIVLDVSAIDEFRNVRSDDRSVSIGAFADVDALAREKLVQRVLGRAPYGPHAARFRLAALDAQLIVAGPGATRRVAFGLALSRPLPAHEIPLAVELPVDLPPLAFSDRRMRRRDGKASFDLRVFAALEMASPHRIDTATVAYTIDDGPLVGIQAVDEMLDGTVIARGTFAAAARRAADAFDGTDERTSVLRRSIVALTLSALSDAYAHSRTTSRGR